MSIAAVVPAAGESTRMGRPKLLIECQGRPLLARVVTALVETGAAPVVVVAPPAEFSAGRFVAEAADQAGARVVVPTSRPAAMRDSIAIGVRELSRLAPPPEGVLIVPADAVRIESAIVARLIDAWRRVSDRIVVPLFEGRRGHPLLLPWSLALTIPSLPAEAGVNRLLDLHADRLSMIPVESDSVLFDLDTPDDLHAFGLRTIRLFAVARERAGRSEATVLLPPPATVGDLRRALAEQHPALATLATSVRIAVNDEYADDDSPLLPDARLALIPPVSGG